MNRQRPHLATSILIAGLLAAPALAQNSVPVRLKSGAGGTFDGDAYSFHHQIGALIDDIFECFSAQMSGTDDNTVVFDDLSELLDPYTDGTQPIVFEFETSDRGEDVRVSGKRGVGASTAEIISFSDPGSDLFPEGFEDPETGTPLTAACVEIGIDDTLDSAVPVSVSLATLNFMVNDAPVFPQPIDITSGFSDPWDGRLSIVFPGFTGFGINEVHLTITTTPDSGQIFSDGFESGDVSSWTQ